MPTLPHRAVAATLMIAPFLLAGCTTAASSPTHQRARSADRLQTPPVAARIVAGARAQVGDSYDPSYVRIPYPNGDVKKGTGVCTDVVVRALRHAGYDLQRLIHEDMTRNFARYPKKWGLRRPDKNIDHRRVPNQKTFFARHGRTLPKTVTPATLPTWRPGDIVC